MSEQATGNIYPCPSNPKIILKVRSAMGDGLHIVGRWDCDRNDWAKPAKFAPIAPYASREECQRALDRWAHLRGVKAIETVEQANA